MLLVLLSPAGESFQYCARLLFAPPQFPVPRRRLLAALSVFFLASFSARFKLFSSSESEGAIKVVLMFVTLPFELVTGVSDLFS